MSIAVHTVAHRGKATCIAMDVASPKTHLVVGGVGGRGWVQAKGIDEYCAPDVKMNMCCEVLVYLQKCFVY